MPLRLLNKGQGEVSALTRQFLLRRQIIYTQMYDSEEKGGRWEVSPPSLSKVSASVLEQRSLCRGGDCMSVDPGDGHPLGGGGHQVHGLLQQADGVVDLIIDDGLIEVVGVGSLKHL